MCKLLFSTRTLILVLGLIFSASLISGPALGQKESKKPQPADQPMAADKASQTVTVSGKVATVSESALTIVDDSKAELTITLNPTTKIVKGGKEATLADVKADDAVVVLAKKGEGDALTAVTITVA